MKKHTNIVGENPPALQQTQMIPLTQIRLSSRFCFRVRVDEKTIERYQELFLQYLDDKANGKEPVYPFQAIDVIRDGDLYFVVSGWHRFSAAQKAGMVEMLCVILDDSKEAIQRGIKSNKLHGLPLSDEDRVHCIKKAVAELNWSSRRIADLVGCSEGYVRGIINEYELRTGTQQVIGKGGKPYPVNRKSAQKKPKSQKSNVLSITKNRIVGELKAALKVSQADEKQRLGSLVNVVKAIFDDAFANDKHKSDFKTLLEAEMKTWE